MKDEDFRSSLIYNMEVINKLSQFEILLKDHLLLISSPYSKNNIKFRYDDISDNIEDRLIQYFFEIYDFLSSPEILKKYHLQLKIARRNGWDGRSIKQGVT